MAPTDTVRLLIADLSTDPQERLFTDEQLQTFLSMSRGASVRRAAAQALATIATSEVLLQKKIKDRDYSTDGPAVADSLLKQAAALRAEADLEDAAAADDGFSFEVISPGSYFGAEGTERRRW